MDKRPICPETGSGEKCACPRRWWVPWKGLFAAPPRRSNGAVWGRSISLAIGSTQRWKSPPPDLCHLVTRRERVQHHPFE